MGLFPPRRARSFKKKRGWGSFCEAFPRISRGPGGGALFVRFFTGFPGIFGGHGDRAHLRDKLAIILSARKAQRQRRR